MNECGYNNGGCEQKCINHAGVYECACESGLFLQADGRSCGTSRPGEKTEYLNTLTLTAKFDNASVKALLNKVKLNCKGTAK